jgi:hypothetical protein
MAKIILQAAAIAVVVFILSAASLTLWRSFHPVGPSNEVRGAQHTEEKNDHGKEDKSFLDRTAEDPVAFFTLWLTFFTGILAAFTVWMALSTKDLRDFAEEQARDMKESIVAAKDSADIARTSLISTQRAYVRVVNFPWLWRPDLGRPGKFLYDITPIVENGGNTQTVDAKINVNSSLRDEPLPDGFDFPYASESGFTLIGARQTIGASNVIILDDDLLLVQGGKKHLFIWGTITYRDVFPNTPEHVTEFCAQISRVLGNPMDPREPNNPKGTTLEIHFRIYPKHQKTT